MARTQIDGTQVQNETLESVDIKDGEVKRSDLNTSESGSAVITRLSVQGVGLQVTSTGADSGTGDVTLELDAGGFGTDYLAYQTIPQQTTTANGWIQAALYTTPIVTAGKYVVHYKAQLTNSQKKVVGFQVNVGASGGTLTTVEESFNEPVNSNVYETRAAFEEITLSTDSALDIQVNYGQTTSGGVGKIRRIAVYLFKVGEL